MFRLRTENARAVAVWNYNALPDENKLLNLQAMPKRREYQVFVLNPWDMEQYTLRLQLGVPKWTNRMRTTLWSFPEEATKLRAGTAKVKVTYNGKSRIMLCPYRYVTTGEQ